MIRALLSTTIACVLALGLPWIATASESERPAQPQAGENRPLDAATMTALGITESPAAEAARSAPVAPESGTWSWTPGQYSYDGSGNITTVGTEASFLYDVRGRLVDATLTRSSATEHREYVYDLFGNRTSMTVGGSSSIPTPTSNATNHLTGLNAVYDAAGNVTQLQPPGQSTIYQQKYDALGSLQEVKASNVAGTPTQLHIYTAADERLWTFDLAANASHWKIRDLQGKVLRDYYVPDTTWTLSRDYIYRDGLLLAAVTPNDTLHYSLDHLGTPRVITGADRSRLGFHHYLPFGEEWTDQSGAQEGEVMKFTGHERDPDAVSGGVNGYDYMHARYYSANVGRFLSIDPAMDQARNMAEPQRWNRYSYVTNNPVMFTDPDGREKTIYFLGGLNHQVTAYEEIDGIRGFVESRSGYSLNLRSQMSMSQVLGSLRSLDSTDIAIVNAHSWSLNLQTERGARGRETFTASSIVSAFNHGGNPQALILAGCRSQDIARTVANKTGVVTFGTTARAGSREVGFAATVLAMIYAQTGNAAQAVKVANSILQQGGCPKSDPECFAPRPQFVFYEPEKRR